VDEQSNCWIVEATDDLQHHGSQARRRPDRRRGSCFGYLHISPGHPGQRGQCLGRAGALRFEHRASGATGPIRRTWTWGPQRWFRSEPNIRIGHGVAATSAPLEAATSAASQVSDRTSDASSADVSLDSANCPANRESSRSAVWPLAGKNTAGRPDRLRNSSTSQLLHLPARRRPHAAQHLPLARDQPLTGTVRKGRPSSRRRSSSSARRETVRARLLSSCRRLAFTDQLLPQVPGDRPFHVSVQGDRQHAA
jgi:hypothetical protein